MTLVMPIHATRTPTGKTFQPAPEILVLNASSLREFASCRLRFFLSSVLSLRGESQSDESGLDGLDRSGDRSGEIPEQVNTSSTDPSLAVLGLWVHAELDARHMTPGRHNDPAIVGDEIPTTDNRILQAVAHHQEICPGKDGARYLAGECDLRWFNVRKGVLVTGRIDALWEHDDGLIEVRDYKTGIPAETLDADEGALMYSLLAAAHYPGRRIRVTYEYLGSRHRAGLEPMSGSARLLSIDVDHAMLLRAQALLETTAESIRKEQRFDASPSESGCRNCQYRLNCQPAAQLEKQQCPPN